MKRQTFNEINITPLTDIFLVLLILMMVIAPILDQQGLSLAVPEYVEQQPDSKDTKILTVTVTSDDRYLMDNTEISQDNLLATIKEQKETYPDGLLIQADGSSSHQSVVKLMDEARNAGVQSISIIEL
ncbi:biopolymer transporter ExbD [bacterium]|nr:biopolymer transporter ExbD [bacterium]